MNFVPYIIWTLISVKIFITDKDLDIILSLLINVVQKRPKLAKNVLNQSKNDQKVSIHALSKTYFTANNLFLQYMI